MKNAILAGSLALILSTVFTALLIPYLKKKHIGQSIEEYMQEHAAKAGTPTMGGIAFVPAILLATLPFLKENPACLRILLMLAGFGLVGFTDDFMKLRHGKNKGLSAGQKLLGQILVTAVFSFIILKQSSQPTVIFLPFSGQSADLGWVYWPFLFLVVLGTDNGVNLTDGIDGLCGSVTAVVAVTLCAISLKNGCGMEPVTGAVTGALLGFLLFNTNPARIFMGDTGSLALGGFVAAAAINAGQPLLILLLGFVYFCETLSVMIQRTYFKLTHGKRIFPKTPIHHSFQMYHWSEARIVILFTVVTVLCCSIAYLGA